MARRNRDGPFPRDPDAPAPLSARVDRRVRFEEADPLGIVWHGRYASYLEDGRAAFGEKYGLAYLDMHREGFVAPIAQMHIDYLSPLRFGEDFTVTATLHWNEAVRLDFEYRIDGADGTKVATAYTVQILQNMDREILLVWPEYLEALRDRWEKGELG